MLLVIDVGNTNIVLGVYNKENLICDFRLNTIKNKTRTNISKISTIKNFIFYHLF